MSRVSIVVPVYNQERYVAECLDSALSQTYRDAEVVVVDDGSTDRTPAVLERFRDRVRLIRQPNAGFAAALNHGVRESRGEYVAWLSSDDSFMPTKLERQVAYLDVHPECDLVYADFNEIDSAGRTLREIRSPWYADQRAFVRAMLWNNFVNGSSVLMRRAALDAVGGFPTSPRFQADGVMWFRMLARGSRFGQVAEPLVNYRIHPGQGSADVRRLQRDMAAYYRAALGLFTLEDVFGDLPRDGTWCQRAHGELGDILAYRSLTSMALSQYLRALSLAPSDRATLVTIARLGARAAREACCR